MAGVDIAIDPVNPSTLYCIASEGWNGSFFRSTDGGEHWMRSNGFARDLIGSPTLPQEPIGDGVSAPRCLAISPRNAGELYIACNWRPCYSNDGGKTWQERIAGADISCIYDIRFDGGKTYAVAMDEGLLCSDDNGARWRQLAPLRWNKEISGHQWRINVANGGKRIVTTVSPWDSPYNAVLLSEDGGSTFQLVRKGLPDYIPKPNTMWGRSYPRALAADPKNPNVLYLGMDGDAEPGKTGGGIFKSEDGGKSWRQLAAQPGSRRSFMGLVVDPTDSRRIYWAASGTGGGVYRSEDAGGSWQQVFSNGEWIFNLAISPTGVLYAPGHNLWRSSDHGKTWQMISQRGQSREPRSSGWKSTRPMRTACGIRR